MTLLVLDHHVNVFCHRVSTLVSEYEKKHFRYLNQAILCTVHFRKTSWKLRYFYLQAPKEIDMLRGITCEHS